MSEHAAVLKQKKNNNTSSAGSILQRTAIRSHSEESVPPMVHEVLRSPGQSLDKETRELMESRFGHDFSQVRVHTDSNAAEFAESINARAFTIGQDIGFRAANYSSESAQGKRLLAHELTHVVQQSKANAPEMNDLQYRKAESEANKVSHHIVHTNTLSQASPASLSVVGISQGVAPGFIQADNGEDQPWYERAGSWALGAIGGEFIDEPTFSQIGVDFVLSIIPVVDQVADARDLVAQVYHLGFRGEYNRWLRWVSLVFTLIGLIPEVGSVIKSLSRAAIRGIRLLLRHIDEILQSAARLIRVDLSDIGRLRRYVLDNWPRFRRFGIDVWNSILAQGERLIGRIPRIFAALRPLLTSRLATLRRVSPNWLTRAFEHVRGAVDNVLEHLRQRMGPRRESGEPFGRRSVGAAERVRRVLQRGGHTLTNRTIRGLNDFFGTNYPAAVWGRALERLKRENGLPNNFHGERILDDSSFEWIDLNGIIQEDKIIDYVD